MRPKQWLGSALLIFLLTACAAYQIAGQVQSGRQALLINKPEEALAYFQQAAQSNPNYIFESGLYKEGIWTYVGRSQYNLGRLAEARQSLEKALSIYPDDYLARIYLGLTLLRTGEDSRGLKELESGMKGLYDWLEYMNRTRPSPHFGIRFVRFAPSSKKISIWFQARMSIASSLLATLNGWGRGWKKRSTGCGGTNNASETENSI
jgi:tetratricopeptide (TPR) repeat protein